MLAHVLIARGVKLDEAEQLLRAALKTDPKERSCLMHLAWLETFKPQPEAALARLGLPTAVLLGMRHSPPWLTDLLVGEVASGTQRLVAVPLTPYGGADAGDRYRHALESALSAQRASSRPALGPETAARASVTWVHPFHDLPGFIRAWVARIEEAWSGPSARPEDIWLLFTAHSVPASRAEPYRSQVLLAAGLIVRGLRWPEGRWSLAWQSLKPANCLANFPGTI